MTLSRARIIALLFALTGVEPVVAQAPMSTSVVHTVSVTVPPRVKVQVNPLSAQRLSQTSTTAQGVSLLVSATQSWVLAIGKRGHSAHSGSEWSRGNVSGFAALRESGSVVTHGAISAAPVATDVFLRAPDHDDAGVVLLTVTAP